MRKLLLADDSVTIQRVIELTFSGEDIQVIAVNDGEQAIARIPAEQPDVVLADIGMPRKGGYDVAAFVKSRADLSHIPVLLLAGAFEPVDQTRAEQVGADGVLIKPFEPRQVIERVKELLAAVRPTISAEAVADAPSIEAAAVVPAGVDAGSIKSSDGQAPADISVTTAPGVHAPIETAAAAQVQSLDDLFESLNQALTERAAPSATPAPPAPAATKAEPVAPPPGPAPAAEPPLPAFSPFSATPWPVEQQPLSPTMRDGDHAYLGGAPFDSAPFDAVRSSSASAATLDDYFDRLSAAFSHTRTAVPSDILPDSTEDFGRGVTFEAPAASHEWLAQTGEPQGLQAFEISENDGNPILGAVSALMARVRSHHGTTDAPHTDRGALGHASEGATAPHWNTEGVPATNTGAQGPAIGGAAAPSETPTVFQRPALNGTHTSPTQHGASAPAAVSPELVDIVTERVLARLVPELTESLRRLVRQELDRTR